MDEKIFNSWSEFKSHIGQYLSMPGHERNNYIFRGHADATWTLRPTLDRMRTFASAEEREMYMEFLLDRFQSEAMPVDGGLLGDLDIEQVEMLARHHGLPTRLLDWTKSPFIGAFFAFDELHPSLWHSPDHQVAIFYLNQPKLDEKAVNSCVIQQSEYRVNPRAYPQRSVFTLLRSNDRDLEQAVPAVLKKFILPASAAERALPELDEMGINPSVLFPDFEGAARSVVRREFFLP